MRFAAGRFVLGVVCAAAGSVFFDFSGPATCKGAAPRGSVELGPTYASAVAPPATPAPAPAPVPAQRESENRGSRTRAPAAKMKLPIIGSETARPVAATEGPVLPIAALDGNDGDRLAGEAPLAGSAASSSHSRGLTGNETALDQPAQDVRSEETAHARAAAAIERRAKPRKSIVREMRDEPSSLAREAREESEPRRESPVRETRSEEPKSAAATERRAKPRENIIREKFEKPTKVAREETAPARKRQAREARSDEAKPTAVVERRATSRKTVVRETREEPTRYAARSRQTRDEPMRHATGRSQEQSSATRTGVALEAMRLVNGWLGSQSGL